MIFPTLTDEQKDYLDDAMKLLEVHDMQSNRVLRKVRAYFRSPDALTKHDLEYEVRILKGLCGEKRDGEIPKDAGLRAKDS